VSRKLLLAPVLGLLGAAVGLAAAGSARSTAQPSASAQAWAIHITVPGAAGATTATLAAPPANHTLANGFAYPADGSVLTTGAITVSTSSATRPSGTASAEAEVSSISIFGGEITASAVTARVGATTSGAVPNGAFTGSSVVGLKALGETAAAGEVTLDDWGYASIAEQGIDTSAPSGAEGWNGFVTELHVHLDAPHGGLPAGSDIEIGFAAAKVQTAPVAPPQAATTERGQTTAPVRTLPTLPSGRHPTTTGRVTTTPRPATATTTPTPRVATTTAPAATTTTPVARPPRPKPATPRLRIPNARPALTAGPYVFPVYGASSYADTFGKPAGGGTNHGTDISGRLGQPILAAANGVIFSVGWNKDGGNRLWLHDAQGNVFSYGGLSAFATQVTNGVRVKAGDVIGFMGATGASARGNVHLHFEIHPASLLRLGARGAVDPNPYLAGWRRIAVLNVPVAAGWAPAAPGAAAPEPGAFLLGSSDISSADGLDPASLVRALTVPPAAPPKRR